MDKKGKRTSSSEEEIVEKVLSNRETDGYQQNKIQRIKVQEVTTMDKQKSQEGIWTIYGEKQYRKHKIILKSFKE